MDMDDSNYRTIVICLVVAILLGSGFWMLKHRHPVLSLGEPDLIVDTKQELDESTPPAESSTPSTDEESTTHSEPPPHEPEDERIDINTATLEEFKSLPGIGPANATRIIDYRNINGKFDVVDDLTEVRGIGEKTVEKLRDRLVAR